MLRRKGIHYCPAIKPFVRVSILYSQTNLDIMLTAHDIWENVSQMFFDVSDEAQIYELHFIYLFVKSAACLDVHKVTKQLL